MRSFRIKRPAFITRSIIVLSAVSFFTDVASEMLYPVIPLFLAQIGVGVAAIGIMEGVAVAAPGLLQAYFGYIADRGGRYDRFVQAGYGLSALAKPLLALTVVAPAFFFVFRFADRFGKALRGAPRDAILAGESTPGNRGKVFGFHRSLDTAGAALGPVLALIFLFFLPGQYAWLFIAALVPGLFAVALTFMVRSRPKPGSQAKRRPPHPRELLRFWRTAPGNYRRIVIGYTALALINGSDFYLLLRARELGIEDSVIVLLYILYNVVFAAVALPLGALCDRFGFRRVLVAGLVVFAGVYGALARPLGFELVVVVFAVYGLFAAANEAVTKAWLSRQLSNETQATGMGLHLSLQSLGFLVASAATGIVWQYAGSAVALAVVSTLGLVVAAYFAVVRLPRASAKQDIA